MYLITAYFDENTNKILQQYIDEIASASGNTFMLDNKVPPHLTISSFETRNPINVLEDFNRLGELEAGEIDIALTGQMFPYVMCVLPVLNSYLEKLAENVYDIFSVRTDVNINRFYRPHQWMPHITLGKKLSKEEMRISFEVMQKSFVPIKGNVVKLGISSTNPHQDIAVLELL